MSLLPIDRIHALPRQERGWTRRQLMHGFALAGAAFPTVASCRNLSAPAGVPDFRRSSDPDDTAAALRAMEANAAVYFPAGKGMGPGGAYLLRSLPLLSGITIHGDGERTVLRAAAPDVMSVIAAASKTADRPLENLVLRDLRIEGLVRQTGFREHWNLVSISGVRGLRIERVQFIGFAGDGLYLGAEYGWPKREPRVIQDVQVKDCLFDGVNNDNRNGISATGGSDITVDSCRFRRCTRPNMPGPIDFEPDETAIHRLERLRVTNCDFHECGGNLGQISVMIPRVILPARQILVAGNSFRGYHGTGFDVTISINREPDAAMPAMDCLIERNRGEDGNGGVGIFSAKGVQVRNNRWVRYSGRSLIGYATPTAGVIDVSVSDYFEGCGWRDGVALAVYKGDGVTLEGNSFIGTGEGGPGSAPIYLGRGRIRRLTLVRNDFRNNPKARGLVILERNADYLRGTTRIVGNLVPEGRSLPPL